MDNFNFFSEEKTSAPETDAEEGLEFLKLLIELMEGDDSGKVEVPSSCGEDPEFGFSVDKPVYVTNIPKEYMYMGRLCTEDGAAVQSDRIGSTSGSNGVIVDMYRVMRADGKQDRIFICPYGKADTWAAPEGYMLK